MPSLDFCHIFAHLQSRPPRPRPLIAGVGKVVAQVRALGALRALRAGHLAFFRKMLIPMPSMPFGTYSSYAKSRQYTILTLLVLQSLVVLLRWVLLLDIFGGFIMAVATAFGVYAYKEDLHVTFLCYWGLMSGINGIFDFVKFIDVWVHQPVSLLSLAWSLKLQWLLLLAVPAVSLPAAVVAWYVYQDMSGSGETQRRSADWADSRESRSERTPLRQPSFQSFGGQGRRLGAA